MKLVGADSAVRDLGTGTLVSGGMYLGAGATGYVGYGVGTSNNEAQVQLIAPYAGYVRKLMLATNAPPGSGQALTGTVRVNAVDRPLTATVSGAASYAGMGLGLIAINEGDVISVKVVNSGAAANNTVRVGLTIQH